MIFQRKLVADWRNAHKWGSMRMKAVIAAIAGIQVAWPDIPAGYKSALPPDVPHYLALATIASAGLAAYLRVTTSASATKAPTP